MDKIANIIMIVIFIFLSIAYLSVEKYFMGIISISIVLINLVCLIRD